MKISIPHRPIHIALFLLLAFLCYQGHQLTRHLVGAALCGGFGTMTFTVTITREPCSLPIIVILSGPVFTYGLAYLGLLLLQFPERALFAYALIFASFSHLRWLQTLTGRGDELVLAQLWSSTPSGVLVAAIVLLIGIPPVWAAFRSIANSRRVRVFVVSWLLPLPVLFLLLFTNRWLFGESGTVPPGTSLLGISWIVLIVDVAAAALFFIVASRYLRREQAA